MDLKNIDSEIKNDGNCGGYKHCKNRPCDLENEL